MHEESSYQPKMNAYTPIQSTVAIYGLYNKPDIFCGLGPDKVCVRG